MEIVRILYDIADILEFRKVEWKPRAYRRAARSIEGMSEAIEDVYRERGRKGLEEIPGVGKAIACHIIEYLETGKVEKFENLRKESPKGISELMQLEGLGPKKAMRLSEELGISDINSLEKALKSGKLRGVEGFGEKTEKNLLDSLIQYRKGHERMTIDAAFSLANELIAYMKKNSNVLKIGYAGSLRRMKESIGDIDILVLAKNPKNVTDYFTRFPGASRVLAKGDTKASISLKSGNDADIRIVEPESYGSALLYFTGSKDHNIELRKRAISMGYKLSEYGLFENKTGKMTAGKTEEDVYRKLKLSFIPPEIRESRGEVEAAGKNRIPVFVEMKDIKGDLQVHTRDSDGLGSIREMAESARKLGYEYIAISDHSVSQRIANGMDNHRIKKQWKEIEKISAGIKILKSAEIEILPDGSLDYPDSILKKLDFVTVAVHSRFKSDEKEMTERIINALSNKYVHMLAHPTGRLIGKREPYKADFDRIFRFASENSKIMEINSDPHRLDLNDVLIMKARKYRIKFCINTDAHSASGLGNMRFGIGQARRGWLTKNDVINTMPYAKLVKFLKKPGK